MASTANDTHFHDRRIRERRRIAYPAFVRGLEGMRVSWGGVWGGVLVAIAGCLRGMQCGSSSSAVGDAATSAVVTSIVLIISACGVFAVVFYILGI